MTKNKNDSFPVVPIEKKCGLTIDEGKKKEA